MKRALTLNEACRLYVNRYTMDHVPAWARERAANGKYYAPQYGSDVEWYAKTIFPGEADYHPLNDGNCWSSDASWPLGQWLDQPYGGRNAKARRVTVEQAFSGRIL